MTSPKPLNYVVLRRQLRRRCFYKLLEIEFENVSFDCLKGVFLELYGKHGKIHGHLIEQYGKFTLVIKMAIYKF